MLPSRAIYTFLSPRQGSFSESPAFKNNSCFNVQPNLQTTTLLKLQTESGKKGCSRHGVALGVFIMLIKNIVYP
jgi:hypothetical protein